MQATIKLIAMPEFLFVKEGRRHSQINLGDILFIQADKKHVAIVTILKCYSSCLSIGEVEKLLPVNLFCRIHRSYIISLKHTDAFDSELAYIGKYKIPIAEQYKNVLKNAIIVLDVKSNPFTLRNNDVDKLLNDLGRS